MDNNKQIQVILIETFTGERYVLRRDKEYEAALMNLFKNLFRKAQLGSLAHISLRNIEEGEYDAIPASVAFMDMKQKGNNNGKEKDNEK